jgi:proteic killer suppression protein
MIQSFRNRGTEDVFDGNSTRAARRACPSSLLKRARRKLDQLDSASRLQGLRTPPGNRLEQLRGDREGQFSIRLNPQYRICFFWSDIGPSEVEILDYHGKD